MALVGIEGLGLNEVVSEDIDKETNETVIDITDVEIASDTTSDISNFSNEITDTAIDLSNIKTNDDEVIENKPSNNEDKITKIDIDAYNQMPNFGSLGAYTFEETYKMYIEYVNEKCISIVDKNTVNENSNSCIIKLNSEENDLWCDRNTYGLDGMISREKIFNNNNTFIYLKNVINNLFIDYYDILRNNNFKTIYIEFDEKFNDEEIKIIIRNFIIEFECIEVFNIKKR